MLELYYDKHNNKQKYISIILGPYGRMLWRPLQYQGVSCSQLQQNMPTIRCMTLGSRILRLWTATPLPAEECPGCVAYQDRTPQNEQGWRSATASVEPLQLIGPTTAQFQFRALCTVYHLNVRLSTNYELMDQAEPAMAYLTKLHSRENQHHSTVSDQQLLGWLLCDTLQGFSIPL